MEDKPFYCKVVDMRITGDVCERRIKQAKEFRDKGEPHASLNKCMICKGLAPVETPAVPGAAEEELCPQCNRPKTYKKLRWNKKHSMHVNCYYTLSKKGKVAVPEAVEQPAIGAEVRMVGSSEDPERIIQCSASPSWVRCHGCYAVKNCAIYDEVVSKESSPAPDGKVTTHPAGTVTELPSTRLEPDTSEQDHYTSCAIQPIEFIVANNMDFLEGNIIKYVARYKNKNGLEDLAKARHYLDMLIEREGAIK